MISLAATNIVTVTPTDDKAAIQDQALAAASAAASKKGEDIVVMDVGAVAITDFFVIVSGANERQVKTIVEEIERRLRDRHDLSPLRVEGASERQWVLMDYGGLWVHVFQRETRAFYDLERLWSDAPRVPFHDPAEGAATG